MLSDLLFFATFSAIFYVLQPKLTKHFLAVSQLFAVTGMPTGTGPEGAKEFLSRFPVLSFYSEFVLIAQLLLLLLCTTLLVWFVFQGFSWKKTYELLGKKMNYRKFCLRFIGITLFWTLIYFIGTIVAVKVHSMQAIAIFPFLEKFVKGVFIAFFTLLTYTGFVSYALLDRKLTKTMHDCFAHAFTRFKLFLVWALALLHVYIALWLVKNSLLVAFWLPLFVFLGVFLPTLAGCRILLIKEVKKN